MKFSFAVAVALVVAYVDALVVNTPTNVVQCQPIQFGWDISASGTPPFFLSVHPGDNPTGAALYSWDNLTGTSFTWSAVPVASGTSLSLLVRDSVGNQSQSAPFTVQPGTDSSCLNGSSASIPSSSGSGSSVSSPTSTPTLTSTGSTSRPSSSSSGTGTGTTSSPASSVSGAASGNLARAGVAGALGALVAAILA